MFINLGHEIVNTENINYIVTKIYHKNSQLHTLLSKNSLDKLSEFLLNQKDFFTINKIIYNRKNIIKILKLEDRFTIIFSDNDFVEEKIRYYEEFVKNLDFFII